MIRRPLLLFLCFSLVALFLSGCPKRPPEPLPPLEKPPYVNPLDRVLEILSFAESLQAKAAIRIDREKDGEKEYYVFNGFVLYQRPDRLRIIGYHPLGMGLFDALYRSGEFFLLIPLQKRAFTGEVAQFDDSLKRAGEIRVTFSKDEARNIPNRIRINIVEKEIEIDIRLKEVQVNHELPADTFQWVLPEGVVERPISGLLRGIK
jgi:outer membrane lipoprotein-sorting protein